MRSFQKELRLNLAIFGSFEYSWIKTNWINTNHNDLITKATKLAVFTATPIFVNRTVAIEKNLQITCPSEKTLKLSDVVVSRWVNRQQIFWYGTIWNKTRPGVLEVMLHSDPGTSKFKTNFTVKFLPTCFVDFVFFRFILWFNENTSANIKHKSEHVHICSVTWTNGKFWATLGNSY